MQSETPGRDQRDAGAPESRRRPARPPYRFQFRLQTVLLLTTAFAVLFAAFRWANLSAAASTLVTLLFVVSLVGGSALITALAQSVDEQDDGRNGG